jgi:Big-like domain-containing protein/cellulase (glycosyl hydrolase family 5)
MIRGLVAAVLVALSLAPAASAGGPSLLVGAAEDSGKSADPAVAKATYDRARTAGFDTVRLTAMWQKGMTSPTAAELTSLQNAVAAANQDGIRTFVVVHNQNSANTPTTDADRAQFVQYAQAVVRALPTVTDVVVGNEPNINTYWLPQFASDGSDAAAQAYEALLAQAYDGIKAVRASVRVFGGALSPRGADNPTGTRPTHSPTQFIKDLGAAYRASGRTAPIMDGFDQHVYADANNLPPSMQHPNTSTITVADYGKLVALLGQAFDGTAQAGSTLPIIYGESGYETAVPSAKAGAYTGTENVAVTDEATQASFWRESLKLAYCQPNVIGLVNFHVGDEPSLSGWQSGPYYADGTPKSSLAAFQDAAAAARAGTLTSCPDATAPTVALTAPANGAVVRGQVTLSATAGDDVGVGKVVYLVNGAAVATKYVPGASATWSSGASGTYTLAAQATDAAGNTTTSAPVTITVDNTPPETTLTPPSSPTTDSPTFSFASSESGSTFQCALDGAAPAACTSPLGFTGLAAGSHTFSVAASDALGNVDTTPATFTWTAVDTTPPDTTLTGGPSGTVATTSASFAFTASEPGTFECSLDAAAWAVCSSPATYDGLADGTHTFAVRGRDAAGNVDPTPATQTWTVKTGPPNDRFANAQSVTRGTSVAGTNVGATKEPGEPNHAGNPGGRSIWFRWTAPTTGRVVFSTAHSSFDTTLGVYRGSSVSALTRIASNDDYNGVTSRVSFTATAGVTYMIAVDGYNGASGSVVLATS